MTVGWRIGSSRRFRWLPTWSALQWSLVIHDITPPHRLVLTYVLNESNNIHLLIFIFCIFYVIYSFCLFLLFIFNYYALNFRILQVGIWSDTSFTGSRLLPAITKILDYLEEYTQVPYAMPKYGTGEKGDVHLSFYIFLLITLEQIFFCRRWLSTTTRIHGTPPSPPLSHFLSAPVVPVSSQLQFSAVPVASFRVSPIPVSVLPCPVYSLPRLSLSQFSLPSLHFTPLSMMFSARIVTRVFYSPSPMNATLWRSRFDRKLSLT